VRTWKGGVRPFSSEKEKTFGYEENYRKGRREKERSTTTTDEGLRVTGDSKERTGTCF